MACSFDAQLKTSAPNYNPVGPEPLPQCAACLAPAQLPSNLAGAAGSKDWEPAEVARLARSYARAPAHRLRLTRGGAIF